MNPGVAATDLPGASVAPVDVILQQKLHPKIREFVEHWRAISPAGRLPGRQHLDPMAIPNLLPNMWLIDVERGARLRFRYRLIGTSVARAFAKDSTGRYLDEVHSEFAKSPVANYLVEVVEKGIPSWRVGQPSFWALQEYLKLERIYLPAARDGVNIDMVFALTVFLDKFGQEF